MSIDLVLAVVGLICGLTGCILGVIGYRRAMRRERDREQRHQRTRK